MTTETKIPALTDLKQRRQALAFEVAHGRDGAEQELEKLGAKNQLNLSLHASLGDLVDVIAPPIGGLRSARQGSRVDFPSGQASAGPRETED
jgi:hypothetical protein